MAIIAASWATEVWVLYKGLWNLPRIPVLPTTSLSMCAISCPPKKMPGGQSKPKVLTAKGMGRNSHPHLCCITHWKCKVTPGSAHEFQQSFQLPLQVSRGTKLNVHCSTQHPCPPPREIWQRSSSKRFPPVTVSSELICLGRGKNMNGAEQLLSPLWILGEIAGKQEN